MDKEKYLKEIFIKKKNSHSYIFELSKGRKNELIKDLLKIILGENHEKHPDFYHLRSKESKPITITNIRGLKRKLHLSSSISKTKVALIEGSENLTLPAVSALLKIIEEPKGDTVIFFTTRSFQALPKTLVSRCQKIKIDDAPLEKYTEEKEEKFDQRLRGLMQKKCFWEKQQVLENLLNLGIKREEILEYLSIEAWKKLKISISGNERLHKKEILKNIMILEFITKAQNLLKTGINDKLLLENVLLKM